MPLVSRVRSDESAIFDTFVAAIVPTGWVSNDFPHSVPLVTTFYTAVCNTHQRPKFATKCIAYISTICETYDVSVKNANCHTQYAANIRAIVPSVCATVE